MEPNYVPESISHDALLGALETRRLIAPQETSSVYHAQLRHSLLSLARKAHLEVAAHQVTGLPPEEITCKSTNELLILLDQERANLAPSDINRLRYWW